MAISMVLTRDSVSDFMSNCGVADYTMVDYTDNGFDKMGDYVRVTFAVGRVISLREANGYHDSDFYATYMRDDGTITEFQYATTRGWTYANGAMVDATDEVVKGYEDIVAVRREQAAAAREEMLNREASKCNLTREQYDRLRSVYNGDTLRAVVKLLSSNLRSPFRIKLAHQVRAWLDEESPKYNTPLSAKQLYYV